MPFTFNFNIEMTSEMKSDKFSEKVNNVEEVRVTKDAARQWFPAEEIFLSEQHYNKERC
jgi:hypothetical protein